MKKTVEELADHISYWRERAEAADKQLKEQRTEAAALKRELQKLQSKQKEPAKQQTLVFPPKSIIFLFCELLGISEEQFWGNINLGWETRLKEQLKENRGVRRRLKWSPTSK